MIELRRRLRFAQEARPDLRAERQLRRKQLDRYDALEPAIARPVDDAHAATTDLAVELIVRRERTVDERAQLGV